MENDAAGVMDKPAESVLGAPALPVDQAPPAIAADQAPPASSPPSSSSRQKPLSMTESAIRQREKRAAAAARRGRRNPSRRTEKPVITPRLSMFKTESGEIDFARTNSETIEQLARAVKTPEARRRLGLDGESSSSSPAAPASTWGDSTPLLLDALNSIAVQLAAQAYALTDDQARILILRRRPDVHGKLSELTAEELDERFPGGLGKHQRLFDIGAILFGFVSESIVLIQQMKAPATVSEFPRAADQAH